MAVDEDMAISFYRAGDPEDLADKLVAYRESSRTTAATAAATTNFSAAMRMTSASECVTPPAVVRLSRHRLSHHALLKFPLLQSVL